MNCSSDQSQRSRVQSRYWENDMEPNALNSIVSPPSASHILTPSENAGVEEMIGELGSFGNSQQIYPHSRSLLVKGSSYVGVNSNGSPLHFRSKRDISMIDHKNNKNSPVLENAMQVHYNLENFTSNADLSEEATGPSSFGNYKALFGQIGFNEPDLPSAMTPDFWQGHIRKSDFYNKGIMLQEALNCKIHSSCTNMYRLCGSMEPENTQEEFSKHINEKEIVWNGCNLINDRKRKSVSGWKAKDLSPSPSIDFEKAEGDGSMTKRLKEGIENEEDVKPKIKEKSSKLRAKDNSNPLIPPKQDYIHVRARRGQATDSHSLAERVRREKISERMKFLQDLVPGCNKVTGKAVMLDEIINYVQSLQHQVEFLSMKLASVNPRLDFSMETILSKDVSVLSPNYVSASLSLPFSQIPHSDQVQSILFSGPDFAASIKHVDATFHPCPIMTNDVYHASSQFHQNLESALPQEQLFHDSFPSSHV